MSGSIPRATVRRLPAYLQFLEESISIHTTVASDDIALATGTSAAQVRKDLSQLGSFGTRGVGYDVVALHNLISRALGLESERPVAIIGAGNLGTALANYRGFGERGFRIVAVYDADPRRIGKRIDTLVVRPVDALKKDARRNGLEIGMIATPADAAQSVTDMLVDAGIEAILNFAPVVVKVPANVTVHQVDLATELRILSYHLAQRAR